MKFSGPASGGEKSLPRLIKATEVAELLGVSPRTLWRLLSEGGVPQPVRLGGSTRWRLSDVESWIAGLSSS